MLVHGGNNTSRCWDRLIPHLGSEVRAVDLPGRGCRPADLGGVSLGDWTEAVMEEIDRAQSHSVVLVGHSLAGLIVPAAAERRAVNGRMARRQIENFGGPIRVQEIDSGHAVMVGHPEELAAILTRCGRESSPSD